MAGRTAEVRVFMLRLMFPCLIGFALLVFFSRTVGAAQRPHAALTGFREGCMNSDHPCWYGIMPSITSAETAKALLLDNGFRFRSAGGWRNQHFQNFEPDNPSANCHVRIEDSGDLVNAIYLSACPLRLGDLMLESGIPDGLCMQAGYFGAIYSQDGAMLVMIAYQDSFTPMSTTQQIRLTVTSGFFSTRWRGFRLPAVYEKRYANGMLCYWE